MHNDPPSTGSYKKVNVIEPKVNLKLSLCTLEKGVTMNDEIVHWLEENKDVDVQVVMA